MKKLVDKKIKLKSADRDVRNRFNFTAPIYCKFEIFAN